MAVSAIHPIPVAEASYGTVETVTVSAGDETNAKTNSPTHTEEAVRKYFKDIPVLVNIARCESHFRHTLADGSVLHGEVDPRDVGVMQINTGYHASEAKKYNLDLLKFEDNMAYARILYEKEGTQPWTASEKCWAPNVAMR